MNAQFKKNDATNKPGEASNATRFKSAVDKVRLKLKVTSLLKNSTAPEKEEDKSEKEFQAVFHANQNEKESLLMSKEKEEENMWDIVDLDDEAIKEYASNELLGQFLSNTVFRTGILCVILFNGVLIAVETNHELEQKYSHLFSVLDQCLMTIFVCEILVKWYHGFFMFWRRGWNVLDFFIVIALLLGPLLSTGSGSRGVLRILRVLRAFRSLRSISSLPGLQIVVQTILQSIPDMANIVLLLVIIMLVFSVIAVTLFRDVVPMYFGNLSSSMFYLFVCLTQDGWVEIFKGFQVEPSEKKMGDISSLPGLQIVVQTILQSIPDMANIVLLLVIIMLVFSVIAVTLFRDVVPMYFGNLSSSMFYLFVCLTQDGWVEIFKGFQAAGDIYDISGGLFLVVFIAIGAFVFANLVVAVVVTNLVSVDFVVSTNNQGQDLTRIPLEKVESYFLILSAIEQNLAQAKKIQGEVSEILAEMFEIQEKAKKEGILRVDERPQTPKSHERLLLNDGDLMSNLMEMESGRVFNSQKESLGSMLREGARVSAQKQTSRNVKDKGRS
ncbi:PREDICTED: cation channel sperm-associated protein 4-like [Acropora digitifera]|uniref:cation channel sperm-associated protein 4-like n=1 Tax=Acropora digitifera TaxID=70779 RepID=UPI00077A15FB|nr:PREDICTED: cation channel sperm-associated protein 4-like [Acropora digitifera]